jgi:cyclase
MHKITDNVYVETGFRGCNTGFVVTKEGTVVIDTPMVPLEAKKWRDEIVKFGPIRYVIDTEPHFDHASGNFFFDGIVVGHEGTREALLLATTDALKDMLQQMSPDSLPLEDGFNYRPPEITLSERLTLYLGEHTFQLINMPGHTPFQVGVYIPEEKVVFVSDNMNASFPIFAVDALPYEWLNTLKLIQQLEANVLVPGHGDICDLSFIPEMSARIQDWIDTVTTAIAKGMTLEEAQDKISLLDRYPTMKQQRQRRNVRHLYGILNK